MPAAARTSFAFRFVTMPTRSPGFSMAGPDVARTGTPLGRALTSALNPAALAPPDADQAGGSRRSFWVGVAPVLALIAGFTLIGVLPSVPLFVFASLHRRARRGIFMSALVAVAVTLFVYGMFYKVLQLPLYPGLLFGGAWQ